VAPNTYAKVGRKWVTFRAFHPDAPVYPNPPRRVPVNGTVRVETRGTVTVLVESDYDDDVHFERTVVVPGPVSNDEEAVETWFDEVVLEETGDGHHQHTCGYCYTGTVVSEGPLKGETREWSGR
jgi:hypothetical protein